MLSCNAHLAPLLQPAVAVRRSDTAADMVGGGDRIARSAGIGVTKAAGFDARADCRAIFPDRDAYRWEKA